MQSLRLRIVFFYFFFHHFEKQIILPGVKYGKCSCAFREELPGGGWGCSPRHRMSLLSSALNFRAFSAASKRNLPSPPEQCWGAHAAPKD